VAPDRRVQIGKLLGARSSPRPRPTQPNSPKFRRHRDIDFTRGWRDGLKELTRHGADVIFRSRWRRVAVQRSFRSPGTASSGGGFRAGSISLPFICRCSGRVLTGVDVVKSPPRTGGAGARVCPSYSPGSRKETDACGRKVFASRISATHPDMQTVPHWKDGGQDRLPRSTPARGFSEHAIGSFMKRRQRNSRSPDEGMRQIQARGGKNAAKK